MVEQTSWEGRKTKQIRQLVKNRLGVSSFYTRYKNRHDKTGLQIVIPHQYYLEVIDVASGQHFNEKKPEAKYHHVNSYEPESKKIFESQKQDYMRELKRLDKRR